MNRHLKALRGLERINSYREENNALNCLSEGQVREHKKGATQ